jgi:hypothetical protein
MNQPAVVRVSKARGDVGGDAFALGVVERPPAGEPIFERAAREVLEHHVRTALCAPVVVDPADVRVRERGDGLGLAFEALRIGLGTE